MPPIAWADVTGMFPTDATLAALPVGAQNMILDRVNTELSATYFGGDATPRYKLARIYYAAHLGIAGGTGGAAAAGPVISESEGGASRSYALLTSAQSGAHSMTSYGRLFDELVRSSPRRIGVTT